MTNEVELCPSICGADKCQLPPGHKWKHRKDGHTWTDAGAERINSELAKKPQ